MTKTKIIGTVIVIFILIFASLLFIEKSANNALQLKNAITILYKINSDMLMMRRNEKDFLSRHNKAYVDRFANNFAIIQSDIEQLEIFVADYPELTQEIPALDLALANYVETFNNLVTLQQSIGLGPYHGYYGRLRTDAHNIEKILRANEEQDAMQVLLTLRRHEKDFMLRNLEKYIVKFEENYHSLVQTINSSKLTKPQLNQVINFANSYYSNFMAYSQGTIEKGLTNYDGKLGDLSQSAHALERVLTQIMQQLLDTAMNAEVSTNRYTRSLMVVFVLGVLVISLIPFLFLIFSNKSMEPKLT